MASLTIILLAIPTIILLRSLWQAFTAPLIDIKGPFSARFTRLWKLREINKGCFEKTNIDLHSRYGPIVRIAPNEYSIDDPEAVKIIYGLGSQFAKSPWYIASGDIHDTPNLFTDRNQGRHAASRRKVASAYSMTSLTQLEPFVDECTSILKTKFTSFADKREIIDMAHWMQCYAFDVIGEITVAKRFGFLDSGEDISGVMAAISHYLSYAAHVGVYSEWHWYVSKLQQLFTKRGVGMIAMVDFAMKQLQERLSQTKEDQAAGQDFLSRMLRLHEENPDKVTMEDVFGICLTNIAAGSDTTSISLSSVLYHLCKHPNVAETLRKEIDDMAARREISDPVTFQQAQKMPYLQAVLKEALRMHPATGLPLGRVVPDGGALISGRVFPKGSVVGINSWVAHANKEVFGPDPSTFCPERWLEGKEKAAVLDRYFFAFGMGSRTCIGKNISLLEMSKLVPQLLRNFDFELEHPSQTWETENVWFVKQKNFNCKVILRTPKTV